jgi:hypothetical protein
MGYGAARPRCGKLTGPAIPVLWVRISGFLRIEVRVKVAQERVQGNRSGGAEAAGHQPQCRNLQNRSVRYQSDAAWERLILLLWAKCL